MKNPYIGMPIEAIRASSEAAQLGIEACLGKDGKPMASRIKDFMELTKDRALMVAAVREADASEGIIDQLRRELEVKGLELERAQRRISELEEERDIFREQALGASP